jgi:hypothetical protein
VGFYKTTRGSIMNRLRWKPNRIGLILSIAGIVLVLTSFSAIAKPPEAVSMQEDQPYPIHGWRVCADLGLGNPPGVPGPVQIMQLCQGEGWVIQVYCLEPLEPAPPVDTFCSLVGDRTFWCGDQFQLVREYIILQTAQPTETVTSTPTDTATSTNTATPTQTATPVPTSTGTVQPTNTITLTVTTTLTSVVSEVAITPTVFNRPAPGGQGNREIFVGMSLVAIGLVVFGLTGILRWRRTSQSK